MLALPSWVTSTGAMPPICRVQPLHAQVRAEVAADGRREGGVGQRQVDRLVEPAFANEPPALAARGCRSGSWLRTGRRSSGFPRPGHTAAAHPVVMTGMALRSNAAEIADQPALAELGVPDLAVEGRDRAHRPGRPFRAAGAPPAAARTRARQRVRCISRRPIFLRNDLGRPQPFPVGIADRRQAWRRSGCSPRADRGRRSLPPTIPTQRPIAEHVFGVLGLQAADHGDAAGHEFGEVVAHRAQHPEFGRIEAGVALGHGHAARADIAGDVDASPGPWRWPRRCRRCRAR